MKAARFYGPGKFEIEEVDRPALSPDGIIMKVAYCGVCGTEIHYYKRGTYRFDQGKWNPEQPMPSIMGHEPSGEVVEVGENVEGIEVGMRVTVTGGGAFAEYMTVPRAIVDRTVFILPDDMSYKVGAMVEIFGSAVRGVKRAEAEPDDVIVIIGAGTLGQCVFQTFKAMGDNKVIICGRGKKRLETAEALGADIVIDAEAEDSVEKVMEITRGRGGDIVADCAGSATSLVQATDMVRGGPFYGRRMRADGRPAGPEDKIGFTADGGKIMLMATYEEDVLLQPTSFFFKDARIIAACGGPYSDALEVMKTGKVNAEALVTHEFPLDQVKEAFEIGMNQDEAIKVAITP